MGTVGITNSHWAAGDQWNRRLPVDHLQRQIQCGPRESLWAFRVCGYFLRAHSRGGRMPVIAGHYSLESSAIDANKPSITPPLRVPYTRTKFHVQNYSHLALDVDGGKTKFERRLVCDLARTFSMAIKYSARQKIGRDRAYLEYKVEPQILHTKYAAPCFL